MKTDDEVNEEVVRLYMSLLKSFFLILGCLAFALVGVMVIMDEDTTSLVKIFAEWLGVILSGGGGIFILIVVLYTNICGIPALIIYDDRLELYVAASGEYQVVYFAEVNRFSKIRINSAKMITIDYKPSALKRRYREASGLKKWLIKFSYNSAGAYDGIPVSNFALKEDELYDLLNGALEKWRALNSGDPEAACARVTKGNIMKVMRNVIMIKRYESPCGVLMLGSFDGRLCLCDWLVEGRREAVYRRLGRALDADFEEGTSVEIEIAAGELDEYFAGRRTEFDVPLLFVGTKFQKTVWRALADVPFGETVTYGALAARIGMPKAVRAVANANRANALSIFAPCHRVIGSDGSLTGYAGGLPAKEYLLKLEHSLP